MTAESGEPQQEQQQMLEPRKHEVSLVLSFSPSLAAHLADGLADYLQQQLRKSFHVRRTQLAGSRKTAMPVLVATAKEQALEAEAESLGVMKEDLHGKRRYFRVGEKQMFKNSNSPGFFTLNEKSQLSRSLLDLTRANDSLFKLLPTKRQQEQATIVRSLVHGLELAQVLTVIPLHTAERNEVWKAAFWSILSPVDDIYEYFGSKVAMYFAWMNFYTTWLIVPGMIGLVVWLHQTYYQQGVSDHRYTPLFTLVMVLWAALFPRFWQRNSHGWAWKWGTFEDVRREQVRPNFHGVLKPSPITKLPERVYPRWKRTLHYLFSALVTGTMLALGVFFMVCSLNLQGHIEGELWTERMLYIPELAALGGPGEIFDRSGPLALAPTVIHVVVISQLNALYRFIATWLTECENHRTDLDFENALITKRFFFEAFDSYAGLFYIAFVQFDMENLRQELAALYTSNWVRRIAMDLISPLVMQVVNTMKRWVLGGGGRGDAKPANRLFDDSEDGDGDGLVDEHNEDERMSPQLLQEVEFQLSLNDHEQFDDYLEMVLNYGYLTLFASAFPLASFLSVIGHAVEMKSDLCKMLFLLRRPMSRRAKGIGTWQSIIESMSWLCLLTNCLLFAYSSDQIVTWFPGLFAGIERLDRVAVGSGQSVAAICFGIEHVLLLITFALRALIPEIPDWVDLEVKRHRYDQQHAERELRVFLSRMQTQRRKTVEPPITRSISERSPLQFRRQRSDSTDSTDSVAVQESIMPGVSRHSIRMFRSPIKLPGLASPSK